MGVFFGLPQIDLISIRPKNTPPYWCNKANSPNIHPSAFKYPQLKKKRHPPIMRKKICSLKIVIWLILFALSLPATSFGWPWSSPASQIESVLNQCAAISKKASGTQASPVQVAAFVADSFQKIDATGCPEDFRIAFQQHIMAWRDLQSAYANNNVVNNVVEGAIAAISDNPSMLGQTAMAVGKAGQKVNESYSSLTIIAAKYGARIPRSVVE